MPNELSEATMQRMLAEADAEIAKGNLAFINFAGEVGKIGLAKAAQVIEQNGAGRHWEADVAGEGDCFYATTDVMIALLSKGLARGFKLCSGEFHHPSRKQTHHGEPIIHAWLEYTEGSETVVVNVANMKRRPVYAISKQKYVAINHVNERLQSLPAGEVQKALASFLKNRDVSLEPGALIDVQAFTKVLLRKTVYARYLQNQRELSRMEKGSRGDATSILPK